MSTPDLIKLSVPRQDSQPHKRTNCVPACYHREARKQHQASTLVHAFYGVVGMLLVLGVVVVFVLGGI